MSNTATKMTATEKLQTITEHFMSMEGQDDLRMSCLLVLAAGDDNARDTLGWEENEEFFSLSLRSVECLLSDESPEVQAAFAAVGVFF